MIAALFQVTEPSIQITIAKARIKLQKNEGILDELVEQKLCNKAQEEFNAFCAISVESEVKLYRGKICAALDRQHPIDLLDTKLFTPQLG